MIASLLTTTDELAELEVCWEGLRQDCGGTIYASNGLIRTWFEAYSHFASPRVIIIEEGGELLAAVPLASYTYRVAKLPMKVLALAGEVKDRLRLSTISPLFRDHRGNDLMHRTMKELGRMKWNLLTAVNLEDNGANRMFIDAVRANWQTEEFPPARKMTLDLPAEGSLMSSLDKKTRKNLEYRRRLLEREGHTMEFRKVCAEDIDPAVDIYAKHHIERWENKGGSYFRNPENVEFLKRYAGLTCRSGQGHFYELRIDGQVAAQDLYLLDGNVVYGDKTGMNNDFLRYSPGWFIQIHALDELRDMGAERYVMGIGGERYKSEMGAVESPLLGIRATRGRASMLGRLSRTSAFKYLDERLDLTKRTIDVQGESPEA